jgi:hypothetical protein
MKCGNLFSKIRILIISSTLFYIYFPKYLSFMWHHLPGLMQFCAGSDSECSLDFVQISDKYDGDHGNDETSVQGIKSMLTKTERQDR